MRITDCRYDRDRLRLVLAYRMIGHEARTHTIRQCTGLSADRIRKLFRDYVRVQPEIHVRRRRGKSPRQMAYFRRTPQLEIEAAAFGSILRACGLLARAAVLQRPTLDEVAGFCDAYDTFHSLCPQTRISFEHGWYLRHVLAHHDEYALAHCPDCNALWVRDTLDVVPNNCPVCRWPADGASTLQQPMPAPAGC